eukprot:CFRG7532T1
MERNTDRDIANLLIQANRNLQLKRRELAYPTTSLLTKLRVYHRMLMTLFTTAVRIVTCLAYGVFSEIVLCALYMAKEPLSLVLAMRSSRKVLFRRRVSVVQTYSPTEYDRTGSGPLDLSPRMMNEVRSFLNDYKEHEMEVHPNSTANNHHYI